MNIRLSLPCLLFVANGLVVNGLVVSRICSAQVAEPISWVEQVKSAVEGKLINYSIKERDETGIRVEYSIGKIDRRLNLTPCEHIPEVDLSAIGSRRSKVTPKVSCSTPEPWRLFVGVEVERFLPVVVLARSLTRKQADTSDYLKLRELNIDGLTRGYYTDINQVKDMLMKRSAKEGDAVYPDMLTPPKVIRKGDNVVIQAKNTRISVKMQGVALSDGYKGQQILVKNTTSNRIVKVQVVTFGQVSAPL